MALLDNFCPKTVFQRACNAEICQQHYKTDLKRSGWFGANRVHVWNRRFQDGLTILRIFYRICSEND